MKSTILVTGIPISGKSETVKKINKLLPNSTVISFGQTIFDYLQDSINSYTEIRETPTKKATKDVINNVKQIISEKIKKEKTITILDSHAVVVDSYGFRVIPEFLSFNTLPYPLTAIIVLVINYETFLERIKNDQKGRKLLSIDEFNLMQHTQLSIATSYSVQNSCPIYIINNNFSDDFSDYLVTVISDLNIL